MMQSLPADINIVIDFDRSLFHFEKVSFSLNMLDENAGIIYLSKVMILVLVNCTIFDHRHSRGLYGD